ncbi:hypothetical protein [Desertibacillus haloalkaliphilus]|uniref:hypothetical protein n=1 Tax=Desertibacillus haloalkaliphilus TaxID=1328930 RepID=UPI001C27335C|nr:hypothetical protein [Desertibacillus haloalkaliphilus]MBU8908056.1 hypothetical protein [Desertibacillus haloalkaliphilus]
MEASTLYKVLPILIYSVSIVVAIFSGFLVYSGLTNKAERVQTRIRLKRSFTEKQKSIKETLDKSSLEERFKRAGYPFKLNASRYMITYIAVMVVLLIYYYLIPMLIGETYSTMSLLVLLLIFVIGAPNIPFSLLNISLNRLQEYRKAKMNSEIFTFHDLLIGEIEMMTNVRVNTYNVIRHLQPYFKEIRPAMTKLLAKWGDVGPEEALDTFAKEVDTPEVKSLVSVLKTLDSNERETAIKALRGMNDLFARSQIENYRRKRKFMTDFGSMPIKIATFLIIINFIMVVVNMVVTILNGANI